MASPTTLRPEAGEYDPFYAGYVQKVPDGDVLATLERQLDETRASFGAVPEEHAGHRYAEGKWSVRELALHLADSERVMAFRTLAIARGDATPLPGFEQDVYVDGARDDRRPLAGIVEELVHQRRSNLALFRGFADEAWMRRGEANGCPFHARTLVWVIAGHERHHLDVFRERYLPGLGLGGPRVS